MSKCDSYESRKKYIDDIWCKPKYYKMDNDGWIAGLSYKGAKASDPGSYGLYAKYYDQGRGTVFAHTMNGYYGSTGFDGYMVGMNYTFAKNMVGSVEWYDLDSKAVGADIGKQSMKTLWYSISVLGSAPPGAAGSSNHKLLLCSILCKILPEYSMCMSGYIQHFSVIPEYIDDAVFLFHGRDWNMGRQNDGHILL